MCHKKPPNTVVFFILHNLILQANEKAASLEQYRTQLLIR